MISSANDVHISLITGHRRSNPVVADQRYIFGMTGKISLARKECGNFQKGKDLAAKDKKTKTSVNR